jgi:hypothetical protein
LPLPEANSEISAEVREWLDRFAVCVREVDYAAARPFWHPDIVIFGTYQELMKSLSAWTEQQWDNVWPRTADFRFDLANTMIMTAPGGEMAVAIAPWTSTGFHEDGTAFDHRPAVPQSFWPSSRTAAGLVFIRTCPWPAAYRRIAMENAR